MKLFSEDGQQPAVVLFCGFMLLSLASSSSPLPTYRSPRLPKFEVQGPLVTITMKEPVPVEEESSETGSSQAGDRQSSSDDSPWIFKDVASVKPKAVWSIQTLQPPLPIWLPWLKQVRARLTYEYQKLKYLPSQLEGTYKFSTGIGDVVLQPTLDVATKQTDLKLSFSRGANFITSRFLGGKRFFEGMHASFFHNLPYSTVRTLRWAPRLDFAKGYPDVSVLVEATTGGAGRTKAILNLEYDNPSIAVVHRLDERNTVSPEISIWNAHITYQWDMKLGSGDGASSLRTKVDPLSAIYVTWTDQSARDGGLWVTDIRLPLEGATVSALAADVRIRRQFRF